MLSVLVDEIDTDGDSPVRSAAQHTRDPRSTASTELDPDGLADR